MNNYEEGIDLNRISVLLTNVRKYSDMERDELLKIKQKFEEDLKDPIVSKHKLYRGYRKSALHEIREINKVLNELNNLKSS